MKKAIFIFFILSVLVFCGAIFWRLFPEKLSFLQNSSTNFVDNNLPEVNSQPEKIEQNVPEKPEELENFSALLERGENFFSAGLLQFAAQDFLQAVQISPNEKIGWKKLTEAYTSIRDFNSAEKTILRSLEFFPDDEEFLQILGETKIQKSDFEGAQKIFDSLSDSPIKYFYSGVLSAFSEDYDNAKKLLELAKNDTKLGSSAENILIAFEEFSLFPDGDPLYLKLLLAKSFNELKFFEMSVLLTKKILKQNEEYRDAWIILGHSYLSLEKFALAENAFLAAKKLDPIKPETLLFLGLAQREIEKIDEAITNLEMAKQNNFIPQDLVILELANTQLLGGYYRSARDNFLQLTELQPKKIENFSEAIRISIEFLDDVEFAENLAKKLLQNYPESEIANNLIAKVFLEKNELEKAEQSVQTAININPDFSEAYFVLGNIFEKKLEKEKAIESFKKCYDLSPYSKVGGLAAEKYNSLVLQ